MDINDIRKAKEDNNYIVGNINYARVNAMRMYDTSLKGLLKEAILLFLYDFDIIYNDVSYSKKYLIYTLRSAQRHDYDEIIEMFQKINQDFTLIEVIQVKSLRNIFVKLLKLLKHSIHFFSNRVKKPFQTAITTTKYNLLYDRLHKERFLNDAQIIVTFCDAYSPDNLITQIAKLKGIKTATLQHGQYRVLSEGNENADSEAYENFISDYLFTWGQATVDEFSKVNICKEKLIKTGALRSFTFNNRRVISMNKKIFGVVLCGETYKDTNIRMIKLANGFYEKYGLKYFLRMHPRNPQKDYLAHVNKKALYGFSNNIGNVDYASIVDFSLIHMTGVFVELLSINTPLAVYKDDFLEKIFQIEPYCISDLDGLSKFYDDLLINTKKILDDQYNKYHYFNEPKEKLSTNYSMAISKILNEIEE
ncbi:hypothetical protein [Clostridium sp. KNHs214]|uniref:hypothetical protein n=1 Tax=Clostridium sp. KNHs214 TaxID=1540257 RepID=UPI0005520694|nr:hypothetical protein [Clostridium sp. KNHs214]